MPERSGFDEAAFRAAVTGRRVLLTGHTGFKGSWLALWLKRLGAQVVGVALPADGAPSLYETLGVERLIDSRIGDIRSADSLGAAIDGFDAEIVFHLAAQAIVRRSVVDPVETFHTNVVGTANVLEAARRMRSLRAVVVVTSDKCYENREWPWGYRETDPMGGADPYSASKGCTELVAASYRRTYFSDPAGPQLATVRAGNVIGGGDWATDRLVPDLVRAALRGERALIRNPASVRPWQHVLDALSGYLMVAARLLDDGEAVAEGWNFGPDSNGIVDVAGLAAVVADAWGPTHPGFRFGERSGPHEANMLALDSGKARARLGWRPALGFTDTVQFTVDWYRAWSAGSGDMAAFSTAQIAAFSALARTEARAGAALSGELLQCA